MFENIKLNINYIYCLIKLSFIQKRPCHTYIHPYVVIVFKHVICYNEIYYIKQHRKYWPGIRMECQSGSVIFFLVKYSIFQRMIGFTFWALHIPGSVTTEETVNQVKVGLSRHYYSHSTDSFFGSSIRCCLLKNDHM